MVNFDVTWFGGHMFSYTYRKDGILLDFINCLQHKHFNTKDLLFFLSFFWKTKKFHPENYYSKAQRTNTAQYKQSRILYMQELTMKLFIYYKFIISRIPLKADKMLTLPHEICKKLQSHRCQTFKNCYG